MPRSWNIAEQTLTVPEINYTFQFGSVHSAELEAGREPPTHDNEIHMKMWDPSGCKCLTLVFDRGGYHVRTELDNGETAPIDQCQHLQARAEDHTYINRHPGDPATPPRDGYPEVGAVSGSGSTPTYEEKETTKLGHRLADWNPEDVRKADQSTQPDPGLVSGDAL